MSVIGGHCGKTFVIPSAHPHGAKAPRNVLDSHDERRACAMISRIVRHAAARRPSINYNR
jgi:hypothetical protein